MRLFFYLMILLFSSLLLAQPFSSQQQLAQFATESRLLFGVHSNLLNESNRFEGVIRIENLSALALPKGEQDWHIYFHFIRKINTVTLNGLTISHIQGDLHRITPAADFPGLAAGQTLQLHFDSAPWIVSYSDFMPRAFISAGSLQPEVFRNTDSEQFSDFVLPLTQPEQLLRNAGEPDLIPTVTPALRFASNNQLNSQQVTDSAQRIIPTPYSSKLKRQQLQLTADWQIRFSGASHSEASYLQQQLAAQYGLSLALQPQHLSSNEKHNIVLQIQPDAHSQPESYRLQLQRDHILIRGHDEAGVFYGIQSLLALVNPQQQQLLLPTGIIEDRPRASWRGMHYDMGRNFHGKDVTLRLIGQMARYKLNKLHLHLTEDEGWRLEIPGLPELTAIGAYRCFDLTEQQCLLTQLGTGPHKTGSGNGYYSVSDFVEILKFAAERHIEVIPEIDLPGHARAAIKAMEARYRRLLAAGQPDAARQYLLSDPADQSRYLSVQNYTDNSVNVCLESSYAFVEKVVYELQQMYRQAGLKLNIFHMGGDETATGSWQQSPACQQLFAATDNNVAGIADLKPWFVSRVADITHKRGLALAGWEDGLMYDTTNTFNRSQFANSRVIANAWDNIWEWGVADRAYRLANNGYQVILSAGTHLYFDHPHEAHPAERGYYWASRYTGIDKVFGFMPDNLYANAKTTRSGAAIADLEALVGRALPKLEQPQNLLGIQGQVWSETIRTAEQLEQMLYPRLLALAERAWHKAAWEDTGNKTQQQADWSAFASRLTSTEFQRLATAGVQFYLPPPGALYQHNQWQLNTLLPGLMIEYSVDQGQNWQHYSQTQPLPAENLWLRSTAAGQHSRVVTVE
ncbi:family 20 glycosylhydrolase [Chromatiaceae bacterium AAb-1]|nr:family 20 glycosylhydrolase [Chromatiaceae bacterium AAb-1]